MKKMKKAFTLIELLVVITIIALLIGLAVPAITGALDRAKQTADTANAHQLGMILFSVANDNNGSYPGGASDPISDRVSAATTKVLFNSMLKNKDLTDTKVLVSNAGGTSAYTGSLSNANLAATNIGWDYVRDLTTTDAPSIPLILTKGAVTGTADAFSSNITLNTSTNLWKDKGFVVYTVGNSAAFLKVQNSGGSKVVPKLFDSSDVSNASSFTIITAQ